MAFDFVVRFLSDNKGLKAGMAQAESSVQTLSGIASKLTGAFALFGAEQFAEKIIDAAKGLKTFSEESGLSIQQVQQWENATVLAGGTTEGFERLVAKLLANIGEAPDKMRKLGISFTDVNGAILPTHDILLSLAERIHNATSYTEKLAIATEAMGKGARELIPVLDQSGSALELTLANMLTAQDQSVEAVAKIKEHWASGWQTIKVAAMETFADIVEGFGWTVKKAEDSYNQMRAIGATRKNGKWYDKQGKEIQGDQADEASAMAQAQLDPEYLAHKAAAAAYSGSPLGKPFQAYQEYRANQALSKAYDKAMEGTAQKHEQEERDADAARAKQQQDEFDQQRQQEQVLAAGGAPAEDYLQKRIADLNKQVDDHSLTVTEREKAALELDEATRKLAELNRADQEAAQKKDEAVSGIQKYNAKLQRDALEEVIKRLEDAHERMMESFDRDIELAEGTGDRQSARALKQNKDDAEADWADNGGAILAQKKAELEQMENQQARQDEADEAARIAKQAADAGYQVGPAGDGERPGLQITGVAQEATQKEQLTQARKLNDQIGRGIKVILGNK
jgi:hypothetical protein